MLNADVPNCYVTLYAKLLVSDCSQVHHQFDKGRNVINFLWFKYSTLEYSTLKVNNS